MLYILDTNTFITVKNTFYAYDIVPSFWSTLLEMFRNGKVKIIDAVANEIADGNDDLAEWIGENIKQSTKVKIPDICQQIGVKYVNLYDMMRAVGIKI